MGILYRRAVHLARRAAFTVIRPSVVCSVDEANCYTRLGWVLKDVTCRGTNCPFEMWMENRSVPFRCGAKQVYKFFLKCSRLLRFGPLNADRQ